MKFSTFVFLITIGLLTFSCDTEPPVDPVGNIRVVFLGQVDGSKLCSDTEYVMPDGKLAMFDQFNFFASDMSVNRSAAGQSNIVDLTDLLFVELTQTTQTPLDPSDNTFSYFNIPVGDYTGLNFTLGLNDEQNDKSPADQDLGDSNPLKKTSHHWQGWSSYIFMKLQGTLDMDENVELDFDNERIVYHTGDDEQGDAVPTTAQSINLSPSFTVVENETTDIFVIVELTDILYDVDGNLNWDVASRPTTHNPDDFDLVKDIMEYSATAFSFSL